MAARPRFAVCVHAAPSCVDCSPLILHLKCGRYSKAYHRVCKLGVRKYFEHAGALIVSRASRTGVAGGWQGENHSASYSLLLRRGRVERVEQGWLVVGGVEPTFPTYTTLLMVPTLPTVPTYTTLRR